MKTVLMLIIFVLLISLAITLLLIYPRRRKCHRRYYDRPDNSEDEKNIYAKSGADFFEIDFVKKINK